MARQAGDWTAHSARDGRAESSPPAGDQQTLTALAAVSAEQYRLSHPAGIQMDRQVDLLADAWVAVTGARVFSLASVLCASQHRELAVQHADA